MATVLSGVCDRVSQLPPRAGGEAPLTAVSLDGILLLASPNVPLPVAGSPCTVYVRATPRKEGKGQVLWYVGLVTAT